jgi:alkanesulfonate monooxygenase SsuD/methylene tetrahydromethanopterin reductase-like flavin-dependent oxidoreductase (luciferase family)
MSRSDRPIGVFLLGDIPPADIATMARHVEAAGFTELWFAEDYFMLPGFSSAAIALAGTSSIKVGIGAVANRVRHPAVTAMEATALALAFAGRFHVLGLGHGVPAWMRQMKLFPKSVLTSLREAIVTIKRLVQGETLTEQGEYYGFDAVKLTHIAPDLKVMGAVVGPKSVELCAQVSDGLQVSVLAGPEYIRQVVAHSARTRAAAGLSPDYDIVTYVLACIGPDRAAARQKIRPVCAFYLEAVGPTAMTEAYGVNDTVKALIAKGTTAADMPDDWLDWLAISGTPRDAIAAIEALYDAGSTSVVLCIVPTEELEEQLELIGREVLPYV